jgi:hypothetical protein
VQPHPLLPRQLMLQRRRRATRRHPPRDVPPILLATALNQQEPVPISAPPYSALLTPMLSTAAPPAQHCCTSVAQVPPPLALAGPSCASGTRSSWACWLRSSSTSPSLSDRRSGGTLQRQPSPLAIRAARGELGFRGGSGRGDPGAETLAERPETRGRALAGRANGFRLVHAKVPTPCANFFNAPATHLVTIVLRFAPW